MAPIIFNRLFHFYNFDTIQLISWGFLTAVYYLLIDKYVMPIINRKTLKQKMFFENITNQLIEKMNSMITVAGLQKEVQESIKKNLYAEGTILLIMNDKNNYSGFFENPTDFTVEIEAKKLEWIQNYYDDIIPERLIKEINVKEIFDYHETSLISKIFFENKPLGYLFLGPKKNLKPYYYEEIKFIKRISNAIASLLNKNLLIQKAENLTSEIIHEIKNTSEGLEYSLLGLLSKEKLTVDEKELLNAIKSEMSKLYKFSKTYLTLEKLDKIDIIEKSRISLDLLFREVAASNKFKMKEKGINIQNNLQANSFVNGDELLLKIVFNNLIENAIKFSSEGKTIEISQEQKNADIIIMIKDHGKGIPEASQKYIFQRWHYEKSGKYQSFGLGLSLCKKIVQRHKGKIHFKSQEGQGTTFFVTLPGVLD
jgi:signal transduction histidine kinase